MTIDRFASSDSTEPDLTFGEGLLDGFSFMEVGLDGFLYGYNQMTETVYKFDPNDGSVVGDFLAQGHTFRSITADAEGRVYMSYDGGGLIYNGATGEEVGVLSYGASPGYDAYTNILRATMFFDENGYLILADQSNGLHVFAVPEPGTWLLCVGALAVLAVGYRQRRRTQP